MEATTKPARHAILDALNQPATSSLPAGGDFRRLEFESLEQRLYLAADIDTAATDRVDFMDGVTNPVTVNYESSVPYLRAIPPVNFSHAVSKFAIPLSAQNLNNKSITYVAEKPAEDDGEFDLEVQKYNDGSGVLILKPRTGFVGTIHARVGIRYADEPDASAWLDAQLVTANVIDNGLTVDLSMTATAPDGSPITSLRAGQDFILHVWAQDLRRSDAKGVFAAYLNLDWNSELAVATGDIQHAKRFFNGQSGDLSQSGSIREAGGFGGVAQSNGDLFEVFSVPMRATAAGDLSLVASPAKILPSHDMLVHGQDGGVSTVAVQYGTLHLTIAEQALPDPPKDNETTTTNPSDPVASPNPTTPIVNPPPTARVPAGSHAALSLTVTAPDGTPLKDPRAGDEFVLHAWVRDVRDNPRGIATAFLNINWDGAVAVPTGKLTYGEAFVSPFASEMIRPGLIADAGGLEGFNYPTGEWLEIFSVPMRATATGELCFATSRATQLKVHEILLQGIDDGIDQQSIYYGQLSLTIGDGEPSMATERPPPAVSAPESQVISVPLIADVPIIVAIPDDSQGGQFAVSVMELLSPAMQAEFANSLATNKRSIKDDASRAALLTSANPGKVGDQSSFPMTNRETDLTVVSRKPNADSTGDASTNEAVTAKTDLSLL